MNSVASELATEPLLFGWDAPRSQKGALAVFLLLSLGAHALCFYVFQIVYPTPVPVLPPPARVTFIAADSDEGRTLLRWIDAEDPALAFTTLPPPEERGDRALPITEYVPTYLTSTPTLKELPPLKSDLRIPSSRPPGAVPSLLQETAPTTASIKTSISFSKEFDRFGVPSLASLRFAASNEETPDTLRFRVAVNNSGEIRYCFAIDSSGDSALDEQARLQVIRSRFAPESRMGESSGSPLVWGIATIQWGNDVARPRKPSPSSVTP